MSQMLNDERQASLSGELLAISEWRPSAPVPCPTLDALIAPDAVDDWLASEYSRLSESESGLDHALAVGLVARLGSASIACSPNRTDPSSTPFSRGQAWWDGLDGEARSRILREAIYAIDDWTAALEDVQQGLAYGLVEPAVLWLHERDNLQGLFWVTQRGASNPLVAAFHQALAHADELAADYHSMWSLLGSLDDDRLSMVASAEPDCWWSQLA